MNYFKHPALNSSKIKSLMEMKSDSSYRWIRAFDKGSLVDFLLTETDDFNNHFEIDNALEPSKTTHDGKFAAACISQNIRFGESYDYEAAYLKVGIKQPYDIFIANYKYFSYLDVSIKKKFSTKAVVLQSDVDLAKRLVIKLINSRINHTKYLVFIKGVYETYGQVEVYGTYKGCPCKIKIDRLIVDYENKTIQLIDIKTTSDYSSNFKQHFEYFNYNIQADFYWLVFNQMNWVSPTLNTDKLEGFTVLDKFIFLVIPTNDSECLTYEYNVCKNNADIETAVDIYKTLEEKGLHVTKQNYYELQNEEKDIELNCKC